jgi:ribosomal protein L37AE/L43A
MRRDNGGVRCANMNHGRLNAPVKYCPMCGEVVNSALSGRCDSSKHAAQRKSGLIYCNDCGKKLAV